MTIGERYDPAMTIEDEGEARAYFEQLVAGHVANGIPPDRAAELERAALGYYAMYFIRATFERVVQLFGAEHHAFGRAWPDSPEEAVAMAMAHVDRMRAQREDRRS